MKVVSEAEAKNDFDRYITLAMTEPIAISKTGHETIVMLSKQEYDHLQSIDDAHWGLKALIAEEDGYAGVEEGQKLLDKLLNE